MCVIAVSPIGEKLSEEVFRQMWEANDDGFGMMFRTRDGVGIVKGIMDPDEAWEHYASLPKGVPHVVHFRLATHGGVRPELTHPFIVDERSPLYLQGVVHAPTLVHNGVWSLHEHKRKLVDLTGPVSDSRVLAAYIGARARTRHALEEVIREERPLIEMAGRVAIVDPERWRIYLLGNWTKEGNFLLSNTHFRARKWVRWVK